MLVVLYFVICKPYKIYANVSHLDSLFPSLLVCIFTAKTQTNYLINWSNKHEVYLFDNIMYAVSCVN